MVGWLSIKIESPTSRPLSLPKGGEEVDPICPGRNLADSIPTFDPKLNDCLGNFQKLTYA